jgi:hypothetical protein
MAEGQVGQVIVEPVVARTSATVRLGQVVVEVVRVKANVIPEDTGGQAAVIMIG